jgi:hypothetical protein
MLVPAAMAFLTEDFATGRHVLLRKPDDGDRGHADRDRHAGQPHRGHGAAAAGDAGAVLPALPLVLAIPMDQAVSATRFINVYLDMVSALTTTGAVVFDPDRLPPAVHLWRARWDGSAAC